jgi:hypothetical protein
MRTSNTEYIISAFGFSHPHVVKLRMYEPPSSPQLSYTHSLPLLLPLLAVLAVGKREMGLGPILESPPTNPPSR